ncbi:hypothetical protein [Streptomyces olivochromogenes]|uniref:hypothetical protein n=1 Tax=Streptomyces olivochromogenes TaxID=1963 RepID=UPI001F2D7B0B|nr:hypothetical protein [Streptomyces olivochromogenes]MCF3135838.1 hypothetical protein [Streptomyces olivochromogenes]
MTSTTVRRVTLSIAVVTALTGVAACGASGSSGGSDKGGKDSGRTVNMSPVAALRNAEKSTDKAESAKVRSTTTIGSVMGMSADGALSWGDGLTGNLTITYTGGTMAESMRKLGSSSMEARYLPDAYYAKMSDKFAQQAGGKHWIRYDYDALAKLGGGSGAFMKDQMQNTTPNQSVKLLLASGDVKKVGEEKVSGENATHYAGTANVADLAGKSSNLSAKQMDDLKKQLTQAGVTTETVDIWVNDQNLLVKAIVKADMAAGKMTQTAYYSDYGTKVSAEKPPASDTRDFTDLMKSTGTVGSGAGSVGSGTGS